jgi:acetyl-CoA C-acetyltransferase
LDQVELTSAYVDEVIIGNARQAGNGPNPTRQIAYRAIPIDRPALAINKACASGLKAITLAYQSVGHR